MNLKTMNLDGLGLEDLLKRVLNELYDDVQETDDNIKLYRDELTKTAGKQMYGELLNNSLKLKGDARDRVIKLINIIKDRVKSKEVIEKLNNENGTGEEGDYREVAKQVKKELKDELVS